MLSTSEVQEKLRLWHIVITGMLTEEIEFNESGVQELTNLDSKVHFQGKSLVVKISLLMESLAKTNQSLL